MLFIDNKGITNPKINLAMEEYVLKYLDESQTYLLFYINEPSIIIGKNQNTIEEINTDYVEGNGIHVVRRLSGGGAVYHDFGNLNFSFVTKDDGQSFHNFRKFTEPVVAALHRLGVEAELSGRNDITVEGRKISGNAMFATRGKMFSHGTLMLDSDIDAVVAALKVKKDKIESKGIKSIRSRVANINEFLESKLTMDQFKSIILENIFGGKDKIQEYVLTDDDWENIRKIAQERYGQWDWNYGKSPKFNYEHSKRFPIGSIELKLEVEKGIIQQAKIFGDFFGIGDVTDIEAMLVGVRYNKADIAEVLSLVEMNHYFGAIDKEEFLSLFY